jgi:small subunit ribosomal protein S2
MPIKLLISRQRYLASGIHIGMKLKTKQMKEFIYKIRPDGLAVLNLRKIDERIRIAAKFLARCDKIFVAGRKTVAVEAIKKFSELVGCEISIGRFMPGTLTNPQYKKYFEADVILILDPMIDYQALKEAVKARVPVIALCNTFNETRDVDLIIPVNNKGKKALATLFWLLAREILKERGEIKSYEDFKYKIKDFEGTT